MVGCYCIIIWHQEDNIVLALNHVFVNDSLFIFHDVPKQQDLEDACVHDIIAQKGSKLALESWKELERALQHLSN